MIKTVLYYRNSPMYQTVWAHLGISGGQINWRSDLLDQQFSWKCCFIQQTVLHTAVCGTLQFSTLQYIELQCVAVYCIVCSVQCSQTKQSPVPDFSHNQPIKHKVNIWFDASQGILALFGNELANLIKKPPLWLAWPYDCQYLTQGSGLSAGPLWLICLVKVLTIVPYTQCNSIQALNVVFTDLPCNTRRH